MNIIQELDKEYVALLEGARPIPNFQAGDTLRVNVKIVEGERTRVQAYEGVCIGRQGGGLHQSFTVRKISYGEGVERVFPLYSPLIESIDVVRRGKVRRAKLYYLRGLRGKSARIPERQDARVKKGEAFKGFKKPKGAPDDLKRMQGVSPELEKRLNAIGVTKYEQIAGWSDEEIGKVDDALHLKGRVERDDWSGKAQALIAEMTVDEVPPVDEAAPAAEGETKS